MKKKFALCITIAISITLIAGCNNNGPSPTSSVLDATQASAFSTAVSIGEMNTFITLKLQPGVQQNLRNGALLTLRVENQSQETIMFPIGFDVKPLIYSDREATWTGVENHNHYANVGVDGIPLAPHGVVEPEKNAIWYNLVSVAPYVADAK